MLYQCGKAQRVRAGFIPHTPELPGMHSNHYAKGTSIPLAKWPGRLINWSTLPGPSTVTQRNTPPFQYTSERK